LPSTHIGLDDLTAGDVDVPFVFGDSPERVEAEPNDQREQSLPLALPMTANGRFDKPGDEDWYSLTLTAGQQVWLDLVAQRYLRSPVDTRLEVFDAKGNAVAQNDDAAATLGASPHDFETFDSKLLLAPKQAGQYFVRVVEQTGAAGPRAIYRLTVSEHRPDFLLYQWPDAVPIWSPGTSAALLVKVERTPGMTEDIELSVEGLPPGWTGSTSLSLGNTPKRPVTSHGLHVFLTIAAPADAAIGSVAEFRVVGRAQQADRLLEHVAQPLTFYMTGDRGQFRATPVARAAIAQWSGPWLEATSTELTAPRGETARLSVRVHNVGDAKSLPVVVNLAGNGVACALGAPQTLPIENGMIQVAIKPADTLPAGTHGIVVALGWRSDIRVGLPGPSTQLIKLRVP
jgi:hypothetical protein